ncbi:MAG: ribokinase [Clostridia bacterium]|nr:ribokinase [Clostridia bacterium]
MKILNIGSCNIDHVYSLDHIVKSGETEATNRFDTFAGGKGLNQSIAAARAGAQVYHAGCIGCDGTFLEELMRKSGVDTSLVKRVDAPNGHAVIQVSSHGENAIFLFAGSNDMLDRAYIDGVLARFGAGDLLLLQNEVNDIAYIVEKAHERAIPIMLNPSPYNEKIKAVDFAKLSYLILNEVEAADITGLQDPAACLDYFKERYPQLKVMLTLGKNGCMFADGAHIWRQPIYPVPVVDTTAAGDTFTGYFLAGIANGCAPQEILQTASLAAAIAVSRKGAAPSIPTRDELVTWNDLTQREEK